MICPFRIREEEYCGSLKKQVFRECLGNNCPAYRYKQTSDVSYKDVCLRLVDSEDKFYEDDTRRS